MSRCITLARWFCLDGMGGKTGRSADGLINEWTQTKGTLLRSRHSSLQFRRGTFNSPFSQAPKAELQPDTDFNSFFQTARPIQLILG